MMNLKRDARSRGTGPVLLDGTAVGDLIDQEQREVHMRVLTDPEIYRLELEHIFARAWVGVAYTTEIPNPGDYVLRYIGEDRVIVVRTPANEISVLLNVCAHRGFEVCWADTGKASSFKCPYHGWTFDSSGNLLGAPLEKEMYGDWDKSKYGLRRARVEVRSGIIFATFDTSGHTLDEWLGPAAWYLEQNGNADRVPLGPPMRFHVHANWKTIMDQGSGDNYHPVTLHRNLQELGMPGLPGTGGLSLKSQNHVLIGNPEGNTTFAFPPGFPNATFDVNAENFQAFEGRLFATITFPGNVIWGPYVYAMPDGSKVNGGAFWTIEPKGPDLYVMHMQDLIDANASEEVKDIVRHMTMFQLPFISADDHESNHSLMRSARGAVGRQQPMRYFAQGSTVKPKGWPGPGTVFPSPQKDDSQWFFWKRWLQLMTDNAR